MWQGGEPLLRADAVVETVALLKARRNGLAFRVVTSGLGGASWAAQLLGSGVVATAGQVKPHHHATDTLNPPPRPSC